MTLHMVDIKYMFEKCQYMYNGIFYCNAKIYDVQIQCAYTHMYAKFGITMIYSLKPIGINVIKQIWLPNEKLTSHNLQF